MRRLGTTCDDCGESNQRQAYRGRIEDLEGLTMGLWSMNCQTEAQIDGRHSGGVNCALGGVAMGAAIC